MADELKIALDPFTQTGLTLLGKVYAPTGAQEGATVSMAEDGPAVYIGDFSVGAVADGEYLVRFETNTPDKLYGTGVLYVRNNAEVTPDVYFNGALDTVAQVTLCDTTTTNTDMITGVATQASVDVIDGIVDAILLDTNELQLNQGQWLTATGFSVAGDEMNLANNAITSNKIANNAFNNSAFTNGFYNSINSEVDSALADYDAPTKTEMDLAFTEIKGPTFTSTDTLEAIRDRGDSAWTTATGFSTFNPAVDVVANVTLVDTTTTNTDMRGTDGANTIPPDNASIAGILVDTNELQTNQGAWATATGFSTPANITDAQTAIIAEVDANEAKIDAIETKTQADARQAILAASLGSIPTNPLQTNDVRLDNLDATISSRSTFNPAIDTVANVTTVATNTDMVSEPDNAGIASILADTNELQLNQSDWTTATGFATPVNVTDARDVISAAIGDLNDFDPANDTVVTVRNVQSPVIPA